MNITNMTYRIIDICKTKDGALNNECIYKNFCNQFNDYFRNTAIILLIVNILIPYLLKLYMENWQNKAFKDVQENAISKIYGSQDVYSNRVMFYNHIMTFLRMGTMIYLGVIIIYSIGGVRF
jgi:hypothetical protein